MKIVISGHYFGITAALGYIVDAAKRSGHTVVTAGADHGRFMPYESVPIVKEKYVRNPDISFPSMPIGDSYIPVQMVEALLDIEPDLWIQVDAGFHLEGKPSKGKNILFETDPHTGLRGVYDRTTPFYDYVFCPQTEYMKSGEIYLPYAADSQWHTPLENVEKIYDVCIIGNYYSQRVELINTLKAQGKNCFFQLGLAQDDAQLIMNQSKIVINWSSLNDVTARVFETMGTNIPLLANRIGDLNLLFEENKHYYGFNDQAEAIEKVNYILNNYDEAREISNNAYKLVNEKHRWEHRIEEMIRVSNEHK